MQYSEILEAIAIYLEVKFGGVSISRLVKSVKYIYLPTLIFMKIKVKRSQCEEWFKAFIHLRSLVVSSQCRPVFV